MSAIFPTSPANVKFHLIPKDASMITYRVTDYLTISAWMPDGYHTVSQKNIMSNNSFYRNFCRDCIRCSCDYLDEYRDEDGDIPEEIAHEHCFVYEEGYHGQNCPEGYEKDDINVEFPVSNMVFSVKLNHIGGDVERFSIAEDRAKLQAGAIVNGEIVATQSLMAANVFGDLEYPSNICWGYNARPGSLREIVTEYFNTPFNNDLLPIGTFESNCESMSFIQKDESNYHKHYANVGETLLCMGGEYDAILTLDAENDVTAFFTMLMAGYKNLEKAPHVILVPLVKCEFEKDGNTYVGYQTKPDDVQKTWYIHPTSINTGMLVGQI